MSYIISGRKSASGGGGGPPSGSAGGDLGGTYPNPSVVTVDDAVLGSGSASASTYLRGDRTWATVSSSDSLVFNVVDYGAVSGGNQATNASAFQDAIDAAESAGGGIVWFPIGTYQFNSTLVLSSGVTLMGVGFGQGGAILNWNGPDGDHAIENDPVNNSALRIVGLRIDDIRTAPTSGDVIHLAATNGTVIEGVFARSKAGAAIYIGNTSGTPDNYVVRSVWAVGYTYGLICDNASENVLLEDIKGDCSTSHPFDSLIYVLGGATGFCNIVINTAKLEVTTGNTANVLRLASTYNGTVTARGLHLGSTDSTGYIARTDSTNAVLIVEASGTTGSAGLIYDSVAGVVYGDGTNERKVGHMLINRATATSAQRIIGAQSVAVTTVSSADLTFSGIHNVALFSTGASDHSAFLPRTSVGPGRVCTVKKIDTGAGHVIVNPNATVIEAIGTPVERYRAQIGSALGTSVINPDTTITAGSTAILATQNLTAKTISSITDSVGNTWTVDTTADNGRSVGIAHCHVTTAITNSDSITVTWGVATNASPDVWIYEVSGLAASAADKVATGTGTGTAAATSATAALTQANEIAFAVFGTGTVAGFTKASTWTNLTGAGMSGRSGMEYIQVNATTALTATGTWSTSGTWAGAIATFKGVSATLAAQIEGASTHTLTSQYDSVSVVFDGQNWNIVSTV